MVCETTTAESGSHRDCGTVPGSEAEAPWVINLRAAMTSLRAQAVPVPGLEHLRIFEVSRIEDGRPRHRLRLGFFGSREDAEAALLIARAYHPVAFAAPAGRDDLPHLSGFRWSGVDHASPARPAHDSNPLNEQQVLTLLDADPIQPASIGRERTSDTPAIAPPEFELSLVSDDASAARADLVPRLLQQLAPPPDDTLTSGWYAVELLTAKTRPARADVPRLDIFAAYSLYAIKVERSGEPLEAIRLGFFRERLSAEQVAAYVRATYPDVNVVPVSTSERSRHGATRTSAHTDGLAAVKLKAPQSNVIALARLRSAQSATVAERPAPVTQIAGAVAPPKVATRSAVHSKSAPVPPRDKRLPSNRFDPSRSGKHKTLGQLLVEEAREVALSDSGIRRMSAQRQTLLGRLVDRLKR